jgi:serine phosphatase RsbU (regulator of sigma subunit)
VESHLLQHGDRVTFGKDETEFHFRTSESEPRDAAAGSDDIFQLPLDDFNGVIPSGKSDLERVLLMLDFQQHWSQVFTPENSLEQILVSALKISGAERAFIMVPKGGEFGYASGRDGKGHKLSEANFQTSQSVVRKVVATGEPVFMTEGIDSDLAHQESIIAMNLRAVACIPLRGIPTEGDSLEILGILYLDSTRTMHLASGIDQRIMTKLATEAGNVLERVEMTKSIDRRKKLEMDLALAEETQRSLLPREVPKLDSLKLHAFSRPTRYVGGDFYHFELMESGELIGVLADVSGKGVAASLLSAMMLGCLQMLLRRGSSPEEALDGLNKFLHEKGSRRFVTMFLFDVKPDGTGKFIGAGHNPSYLYRAASNSIEELTSTAMMVGAFDFATFESSPFEMQVGDILLVYTDGLTEAEAHSGEMFGEERVKEIILREASSGADQMLKSMLGALETFTGSKPQTDDITIVIAERTK